MPQTVPAPFPWADVWGQDAAVDTLRAAASDPSALSHAWLITGPPGSGRSTLAYAFAAALIADRPDDENVMRQVLAGTHPDVTALRTDKVIITIAEARGLVERSYFAPSAGRYRVIVVEDADRMVERTSNVLLKALEEPPEQTVWILCAPSEADLLPTIRSRVRSLRLREPDVADVARLISLRTGVDEVVAEQAARHAQRHIGMAQRLATDDAARRRRDETLRSVLGVRGVGDAVEVAGRIIQAATEDAKALTAERDAQERASLLRTIGIAEGQAVPPALRTQLSALEDDQKKRATRSLRDGIDRVLTDLQSLFRDVVMLQFGRGDDLINSELRTELTDLASAWSETRTLVVLDHLADTRQSLERNVAPLLALESLLVTITSGRKP
ncbi:MULTISPECIES: DNA polymerase III subunit delta' [Microbacterium]|jgi:DNA polymerase-3 subunit delta'|uniref:DNA polymerase III subunit delta' n=2 Tax=Microbacterium TaxID=33882 RepID=A0A4Y4B5Y2_MICMQ|nr:MULTISPECIES: DNA polymerase III subunit delta' [Microbacterium]AZS48164.1 DNA polymerase III subunit gamma/tau [Microbacterium oxydans]KQV02043.1 DNA polymerase III subunit delta' [Microbacterium sp. Root322]QYG13064.1 DNA polymerase III subunit delta' [Microbacterium sp. PAMC22086]WKT89630.1 DNA polymerase III subunit delta' [Microbacterium liquefaciens]GEC74364.1 DNA polymerase III subunit delta' [Microbacterium liquefaciens]